MTMIGGMNLREGAARINAEVNAETLAAVRAAAGARGISLRWALEQAFALWVELCKTPAAAGSIGPRAQLEAWSEAHKRDGK